MASLGSLIGKIIVWKGKLEVRQIERLAQRSVIEAEKHKLEVEQLTYNRELCEQEAQLGKLLVKSKKLDMSK